MLSADITTEFIEKDRVLIIKLFGEIDHHSAYPLREASDREIIMRQPKKVVIDLTEVSFMDSAGLGYILGRYSKSQLLKAEMEVTGASDRAWRILQLAGADKLLKIQKSDSNEQVKAGK